MKGKTILKIIHLPRNSTDAYTTFLVRVRNNNSEMIEILSLRVAHEKLQGLLNEQADDVSITSKVTIIQIIDPSIVTTDEQIVEMQGWDN